MTREEALLKLLAFEPETRDQIILITGWPAEETSALLDRLVAEHKVGYGIGPYTQSRRKYQTRKPDAVPDVRTLDRPTNTTRNAGSRPASLRAGSGVGVPAAARQLRSLQVGAAGRGREAAGMEGAR